MYLSAFLLSSCQVGGRRFAPFGHFVLVVDLIFVVVFAVVVVVVTMPKAEEPRANNPFCPELSVAAVAVEAATGLRKEGVKGGR